MAQPSQAAAVSNPVGFVFISSPGALCLGNSVSLDRVARQGVLCLYLPMSAKTYRKKLVAWSERRKKIVSLRDDSELTFDEIAKIYNVTRQRVLQLYQAEKAT